MTATIDKGPATVNYKYRRGDTVAEPITIIEGGIVTNITGRTYRAHLRQHTNDATPILAFTIDLAGASTGGMVLRLTAAETAALEGSYYWDLEQTSGGVVRTLLAGVWVFTADVTHS